MAQRAMEKNINAKQILEDFKLFLTVFFSNKRTCKYFFLSFHKFLENAEQNSEYYTGIFVHDQFFKLKKYPLTRT